MKLAIAFPSTIRGGAEEHALTLASAAVKEGWQVYAAFPNTQETASLIEAFQAVGVDYRELNIADTNVRELKKVGDYLPQLARTLALLVKIKPDVVQLNLPYPDRCFGSLLACGLLKIPTAVVFQLVPPQFSLTPTILKVHAWARKRNQQWIAISQNNRRLLCDYFQLSQDQLTLIYNGTKIASDANDDSPQEIVKLRDRVREELGLSKTSKLLLTVGRLSAQKGYHDLIPIVAPIVSEFPEVKFIWVGEGEKKESLVKQAKLCGVAEHILFLGYRSDVARLLKAADLFVFPTYFEGLPFAPIEALANGLPIVASNASSLPEIVEDKVSGLLFPVGDKEKLLESILWALRNPEAMQEMACKAKLRARNFSQEKMIKDYIEVWQALSGKSLSFHYPSKLNNEG
ncbi:glycosyltransferase [Pleurocapsa sp. PCC 7327]|uniref:glycosyltransferase family 4 protein n=1 Tax=Pleurocapsa sp. PCC 7327 TaxID=118163 RepID=UPI00029FBFA5|nr:glycosyltransferase family 4 protein [Pleurocapsa sp. PCC 7327]AFY75814.1 glycosyltransferase [Pleurocapsa sp. PCC 7327]